MSDAVLQVWTNYAGIISAIVAVVLFGYPIWRWFAIKRQEASARQFDIYHKMIQELVEPAPGGTMRVQRQMAVIYELRNFRSYYPASYRITKSLHHSWSAGVNIFPDLLTELVLAQAFFKRKKRWWVNLDK